MINEHSPFEPPINNPELIPIDAFGQNLAGAIKDVHRNTGTPISAVASMTVSALSLSLQGRIRVRKFEGNYSPVSIWFILIMESGERKTALVNTVFKEVMNFHQKQLENHSKIQGRHEAVLSAWKSIDKGINDRLRAKTRKDSSVDAEMNEISAHALKKPMKQKGLKLWHENVTPSAIVQSLHKNYPTTSLISSEGANIFNSRAMSDIGLINTCWESGTINWDRVDHPVTITDPCLTLAILSQEKVANDYFSGKGALARSSGFLARCYYIKPLSMAGNRPSSKSRGTSAYALEYFYRRCSEILEGHCDKCGEVISEKEVLKFSHDAQRRWFDKHDEIESMMAPGGYYENAKDFASKQADKIARLSALLHYFDGASGPISLSYLDNAVTISDWFAHETMKNIMPQNEESEEYIDSKNLEDWLARYFYRTSNQTIVKNDILRHGPNSIRKKDRLDKALDILMSDARIVENKLPGERVVRVFLHNDYFCRLIHSKLSSGEISA